MPRDTLNEEKHQANSPDGPSLSERIKNWAGVRHLRDAIGKQADKAATSVVYQMTANGADVKPPELAASYKVNNVRLFDGNTQNKQLQPEAYTFNNPPSSPNAGQQETIHGFHLKAQQGKPTVVYFGGSEFDRSSDEYQATIKEMASKAREQGMGFVTFDYPSGSNEAAIKEHVKQLSDHLEQNGVPKNQQAYAGFSLGGFPAMYAAEQNPEAAGLHVTSTFSSLRQASKDGMKDTLGPLAAIVPKHQISEMMDNVALADNIVTTQQQRANNGQAPMPISMICSEHEDFGKDQNRHMEPLAERFEGYPDKENTFKSDRSDFKNGKTAMENHLNMPKNLHQMNSFEAFTADVSNRFQAPVIAVVQPPVNVDQGPELNDDLQESSEIEIEIADNDIANDEIVPEDIALNNAVEISEPVPEVGVQEVDAQEVGKPSVRESYMAKHRSGSLSSAPALDVESKEVKEGVEAKDPPNKTVKDLIKQFGGGKGDGGAEVKFKV